MTELVNKILNKQYDSAKQSLDEELSNIVERKLCEKKKMIAAELDEGEEKEDDLPFDPDEKKSTNWTNPRRKAKNLARQAMKAATKKKTVNEAVVNDEGLVELPTGERVLASVYRQRRWLAEESLEKDDDKVQAALAKAKMLLQPQLDATSPTVNRKKISVPKGTRPADRLTAPDEGPREDEWESGKGLKEASFSTPSFGTQLATRGGSRVPNNDQPGTETQPSGAKTTTPSQMKPTEYSGETSSLDKLKAPVKGAIRSIRRATGMSPEGIYPSKMNEAKARIREVMEKHGK